jgi:signal transduction histidine kinase
MLPTHITIIAVIILVFLGIQVMGSTDILWGAMNAAFLASALLFLLVRGEKDRRRAAKLDKLKAAYDALDEQAKLIIKTDLELNRTQEELDKKVRGLMTLQSWGQRTRVMTKTEELLTQFDDSLVFQLGYDRGYLMLYERGTLNVLWQFFAGFPAEYIANTIRQLHQLSGWDSIVNERKVIMLNAPEAAPGFEQEVLKLCGLSSMVIVPMPLKDDERNGIIAVGHEGLYAHVTAGDTDLIGLLSTQLATDLENVQLYEELWDQQRSLERKVTERTSELAGMNEELKRLNRAKSDFVNAVAHELRTPLTSIKGYASILCSGQLGEMEQKQKDRIAKIDTHSNDLGQLINDLLDISRIESGKTAMDVRRLSTADLFADLDDVVRPLLDAQQITLDVDAGKVSHILADKTQIKRVFMNLLSNAIKYTPEQGTIRMTATAEATTTHITVSDTGAGIPPDDLPHLFEEFYRARTTMNTTVKGTGLGLTLVQRIVEAHGGKIWAESEIDRGSVFHVTLPAQGAVYAPGAAAVDDDSPVAETHEQR